ncbi:MAG: hypothetical protein A3J66_02220 [Candidatus Magasanikbacteria bacterium RIFCSPHIGHO2_02_FULL_47_14]|uniref:Thioredoxin-like fold domain-containing protein n=1 Tax=Candidatus Magasanikbacteria bacterium RIFCSPHIGHO2_02_FULL_47_14 TaxID=1798680 RepID=A0A1F6MBB5_9BACT|nr:MAG: hypothetical protein A3J66_02220 [Candidatus Magasanikbacteria bacterium RIFCSPHIGHO2_02_FULL_47_14]
MMKTRHLLLIFVPAIIVSGIAFFVRYLQYEPLYPEVSLEEPEKKEFQIPLFPKDPVIGDKRAAVTVVAFEDFGCQGCKIQHDIFEELFEEYPGRIKLVWKGLPITRFPYQSRQVHVYGYCANEQEKFTEFEKLALVNNYDLSLEVLQTMIEQIEINQKKFDECLVSPDAEVFIQKNETLAKALDIQSVPTFFINNKQVEAPSTKEGWVTLLGLRDQLNLQ